MRRKGAGGPRSVADEALIRAVFDEHGRALLAYATRLIGDRSAAEDIVQETLVRAWRNPEVLTNSKGSVRGWLLTVARNLVIDVVRARAARPVEVAELPADATTPGDHAEAVVNSVVVLDALEHLSGEQREVLKEVYFKGNSVAETAAALGIPQGTVRSRSYYALRSLRQLMATAGIS